MGRETDALAAVYALILSKRKKKAGASSDKDSAPANPDTRDKPERQ